MSRTMNIIKRPISIEFDKPQKIERVRYCITIIRGDRVATACGEDLEKLVHAVSSLQDVDFLTLNMPLEEREIRLRKIFR